MPVLLIDEQGRIEGMNHAAAVLLKLHDTPCGMYYNQRKENTLFVGDFPLLADEHRECISGGAAGVYFEKPLDGTDRWFSLFFHDPSMYPVNSTGRLSLPRISVNRGVQLQNWKKRSIS